MRIREKNRDLERRLAAERPRAPEELVQTLARRVSVPEVKPRRSVVPRVAVIAAVTAVIAISLDAAGAVGYATSSLHTLGKNLEQIVSSPPKHGDDDDKNNRYGTDRPFQIAIEVLIPTCQYGSIKLVPIEEYYWILLRGGHPARFCVSKQ